MLKQNSYIEKVDHQNFIPNCIIFKLWGKIEYIYSNPHHAKQWSYLSSFQKLTFCYYNINLTIIYMEAKNDKIIETNFP